MVPIIFNYFKQKVSTVVQSQEDIEDFIVKAGFRIIHIESSVKKYTFPDIKSLLGNTLLFFLLYLHFMFKILRLLWIKLIV